MPPPRTAPPTRRRRRPPPPSLRHRRRLGQVLGRPIDHPSAWYGDDMRRRQHEWVYTLSEGDVAELEAATAAAAATGKAVEVRACVLGGCWLAGWCFRWPANGGLVCRCRSGLAAAPVAAAARQQRACSSARPGCTSKCGGPNCRGRWRPRSLGPAPSPSHPLLPSLHRSTEQDITIEDFPLPTLGPKLRALLREVTHGR